MRLEVGSGTSGDCRKAILPQMGRPCDVMQIFETLPTLLALIPSTHATTTRMSSSSDIPRRDSGLRIRIDKDSSPEESVSEKNPQSHATKSTFTLPQNLEWIPKNWTWTKVKPVIRCAVAAWVSSVLFIIPAVEIYMGQVGVLSLSRHYLVQHPLRPASSS